MFRSVITFILFVFAFSIKAQLISCAAWEQIVPSSGLPKELEVNKSNNNLDLVWFNNRYYFAFRTAPSHFASEQVVIYIVSSKDLINWKYEKKFYHNNDLREPRFLVYCDKLFFYYFEGGNSAFTFEPRHIWACDLNQAGNWSVIKSIGLDGYVPWRFRIRNDTMYLSAYNGVGLYSTNHQADLRLFVSQNGYDWKPISEDPQITLDSSEEGEFIFDKQGNLWGTVRLESIGALIVYADKNNLSDWRTKYTKYKYDSALLFRRGNDIYLISRRNVDGVMDHAPAWFSKTFRKIYNLIRYSLTTKKTALFKLNKKKMELVYIMDLLGFGDTAFPALAQKDANSYVLMNYTSDIGGDDKIWLSGQLSKSFIYMTELCFE